MEVEKDLLVGDDLAIILKRKANQYLRIGGIILILALVVAFVGGIMNFLVNQELTFKITWLILLWSSFPLGKGLKLRGDIIRVSEKGLPRGDIKNLHTSKINKILSKTFLGIIIALLVISGAIWFGINTLPAVEKDYGIVVNDEVETTGWLTYKSVPENFQIDFSKKPKSLVYEKSLLGEGYNTYTRRFVVNEDPLFFVNAESLVDTKTGEKIEVDINIRDIYEKNTDIELWSDFSILEEQEDMIMFNYKEITGENARQKIIVTDKFIYYLGYSSPEEETFEDNWNHYLNSFSLISE
jgi:hypothetical protein